MLRLAVLGIALAIAAPAAAQESGQGGAVAAPTHFPIKEPELQRWTFAGPFGNFDQGQLQRGYFVYKEVCSTCHSMRLVAFRNLSQPGGPGFTDAQVKALAETFKIQDGPNDQGEMFERPGRPSDHFPSPYPNPQAAAAALGAAPPDLSMIAKARGIERGPLLTVVDFFTQYQEGGPDYIHALLTGYQDPPPGFNVPPGGHYNPYFNAAAVLAMPPPLTDGAVPYTDGAPQTVDQYARDVSAFLMWAAEPHLVERKRMGMMAIIFLVVFAGLMFATKRKVWSGVAH
ncbi:MAG: cytochrome c1 [Rhizobiales bacterium]|nr:cytochrome c1 [Hyphomicrobiales bacterium]MBN9010474.1 cytochrome c1 [Hyphomicrobiales bacterium]